MSDLAVLCAMCGILCAMVCAIKSLILKGCALCALSLITGVWARAGVCVRACACRRVCAWIAHIAHIAHTPYISSTYTRPYAARHNAHIAHTSFFLKKKDEGEKKEGFKAVYMAGYGDVPTNQLLPGFGADLAVDGGFQW